MQREAVQKRIVILLMGESGSGKTHLCRVLFGDNAHPTQQPTMDGLHTLEYASAWKYNNQLYQVTLLDTRGALDANNRHNARSIVDTVNARYPIGVNYIFVCIKVGRINLMSRECIFNIMSVCKSVDISRIKIIFTHCDGWSNIAIQDGRTKWLEYLRTCDGITLCDAETLFVGSLPSGIESRYEDIKNSMEESTRREIGRVCSTNCSNDQQSLLAQDNYCLLS